MISRFTKYTPLDIPQDNSADFFIKALDYRMKKEDAGVAELQAFADATSNIDILRASDKEYFDTKYKALTEEVNNLSTLDLTNPSALHKAKQTLSTIKDDPRIVNALKSTQNARKVVGQWDKVMTDPRLKAQYNSVNHSEDLAELEAYLNGDEKASFGLQGARLYDGFHENLLKDVMKLDPTTMDYGVGDGDFSKTIVKGRSRQAIMNLAKDRINSSQQLQIEFNSALRTNPKLLETNQANIKSFVDRSKRELNDIQVKAKSLPENNPRRAQLMQNAQELANDIEAKERLLTADPKTAAWEIYKDSVAQRMINIGGVQSVSVQLDPTDKALFDRKQKIEEFEWRKGQDNIANMFTQQELDLKDQEIRAKSKTDLQASLGLAPEQYTLDSYEEVPTGTEYSIAKQKTNQIYLNQISLTKDLLKDLHSSIAPVEFAKVQQVMKARGLDLDNLNLEKNSSLFFPKNLDALNTAITGILENSGNPNTPLYSQISQKLSNILEMNQLRIIEAGRLRQAEDEVKKETGYSPNKKIQVSSSSFDPAGILAKAGNYDFSSKEDEDFQKKVNEKLRLASGGKSVVYSYSNIPISTYASKDTKEYVAFSNNVQTTLKNSDFVTSEDGSIQYPLNSQGVSKTKNSKSGDIIKDVDWSKSEALYIDPRKQQIIVQLKDKEGVALEGGKKFAVPLNQKQVESLSTSLGYNYNQLVDVTETVDMNIDNNNYDSKAWGEISKSLMITPTAKYGLPSDISLPFKVLSGSRGRRTIAFSNNGQWHTTSQFPTINQFQGAVGAGYRKNYEVLKKENPNALDKTLRQQAFKKTIEQILDYN